MPPGSPAGTLAPEATKTVGYRPFADRGALTSTSSRKPGWYAVGSIERSPGAFRGPTDVGSVVSFWPRSVHRPIESMKIDTFCWPSFSSITNASAASLVSPAPEIDDGFVRAVDTRGPEDFRQPLRRTDVFPEDLRRDVECEGHVALRVGICGAHIDDGDLAVGEQAHHPAAPRLQPPGVPHEGGGIVGPQGQLPPSATHPISDSTNSFTFG